jgi:ABC-2 type transport system ATP-binding protein
MTDVVIGVEGLVKRFGNFAAVDGLSFQVGPGRVHGFLGPNGAGKSTTIRVLLGFLRATNGQVRVHGLDPATDAAAVTRLTSYVPGDVALWGNLTGQEVLDALAGLRGAYDPATEKRLVEAFALDPGKKIRVYSKGNRQKVMLIAAFAARTKLLVLDEPTSGLDPLMEQLFENCVREAAAQGRAVLLSSHMLVEVEHLCETVTIIKDGRLVESARLDQMQHLAASTITAQVPADRLPMVRAQLDVLSLAEVAAGLGDDGRLSLAVPRTRVNAVMRILADAEVADLNCAPATLEDLFLRHYAVAAR